MCISKIITSCRSFGGDVVLTYSRSLSNSDLDILHQEICFILAKIESGHRASDDTFTLLACAMIAIYDSGDANSINALNIRIDRFERTVFA